MPHEVQKIKKPPSHRFARLTNFLESTLHSDIAKTMTFSTDYGKRLIPQILDGLAATEPDRVVYSVSTFSDSSHGFQQITAGTFAKAVDKTAWWLHSQIEKSGSIQAVGYIGPRRL